MQATSSRAVRGVSAYDGCCVGQHGALYKGKVYDVKNTSFRLHCMGGSRHTLALSITDVITMQAASSCAVRGASAHDSCCVGQRGAHCQGQLHDA
jgi:hypothetical protein